jgi:hypothetical protein
MSQDPQKECDKSCGPKAPTLRDGSCSPEIRTPCVYFNVVDDVSTLLVVYETTDCFEHKNTGKSLTHKIEEDKKQNRL